MTTTVNYHKLDHRWQQHHRRYAARVAKQQPRLVCQECRGAGGEVDVVMDFGQGPWNDCGYCEGTGFVTPWLRGLWLKHKREESKNEQVQIGAQG